MSPVVPVPEKLLEHEVTRKTGGGAGKQSPQQEGARVLHPLGLRASQNRGAGGHHRGLDLRNEDKARGFPGTPFHVLPIPRAPGRFTEYAKGSGELMGTWEAHILWHKQRSLTWGHRDPSEMGKGGVETGPRAG